MSGTPDPQKKLWVYFHLGLLYSGREPRTKDRDMGFFSDLKMAFNPSSRTKDYEARTARTIAKTDPARADRYAASKGVSYKGKNTDIGNTALSTAKKGKKSSGRSSAAVQSSLTFADEVLKDPSRFLPPSVSGEKVEKTRTTDRFGRPRGPVKTTVTKPTNISAGASTATDDQRKKDRDDFLRNFDMQRARADADPTGQSYQMYGRSVNLEKDPTLLQQGIGGGMTGSLLNYAAGSRPLDPIVNIIDGKPIYQDSQGRTYAYDNLFGLRYDTTGADSLDVLPRDMPQGSDDDDDRPAAAEVVAEKAPDDPCPDGYRMNPETKQCELDPFKQPFADAVTTPPAPVVTAGLSPYTQMAPVTLGQLQPTRVAAANPLTMQQANMPPAGGLGSLAPVIS